jgi:AraC-like DNA-binding protein
MKGSTRLGFEGSVFSKFHFTKLFYKSFGMIPDQFPTDVWLDNAGKFLRVEVFIQEICWIVGFESIGSFVSFFKRRFGMFSYWYDRSQKNLKQKSMEMALKFIHGSCAEDYVSKEKHSSICELKPISISCNKTKLWLPEWLKQILMSWARCSMRLVKKTGTWSHLLNVNDLWIFTRALIQWIHLYRS